MRILHAHSSVEDSTHLIQLDCPPQCSPPYILHPTSYTAVFACFGLARTTPILFALCAVEGLAAMWDAALTVHMSVMRSSVV